MRVLYVLHRYHPNMISTMKGWKEHGDEVCVLSQYQGKVEDHTYVKPIIVGYSAFFNVFYWFYVNVFHRRDPFAKDINLRLGFPPIHRMAKHIEEFKPDLVILRERSFYTMVCYAICKRKHYRAFLFNLSPVWAEPSYFKDDIAHRIVRKMTPTYRLTPSNQIGIDMTGKVKDVHSYMAPFIVEPLCAPEERSYFHEGRVNILEIGKYQKRKNHFLMVHAFERLKKVYPDIRLTIIGEISDRFHQDYYDQLSAYIVQQELQEDVILRVNVPKKEVGEEFRRTDLFILPSTGEPASISVIEPMAYSVPVIGGSDNGTADYIEDGISGYVFKDCDEDDLYTKMNEVLQDKQNIPMMGAAAYRHILKDFQFENYYRTICCMMQDQDRGV